MRETLLLENLDEISLIVAARNEWSEDIRLRALRQYTEYLDDIAAGTSRRPTVMVDLLWHEHILNTHLYTDYTFEKYGKYIHHVACVPSEFWDLVATARSRGRSNKEELSGASASIAHPASIDDVPARLITLADCGNHTHGQSEGHEEHLLSLADCGDISDVRTKA